jgi:hypothetical protein
MGPTTGTISLHPVHGARRQRVGVGSTAQSRRNLRVGRPRHGRDRISTAVVAGMNVLDNDTTTEGVMYDTGNF